MTEYAATVGESVKARVQETVGSGGGGGGGRLLYLSFSPSLPPPCPPPQPVSFMNKFQEEQDKFTRERRRLRDAAVPPWVGYNEEEQMKAQILELSAVSHTHPPSLTRPIIVSPGQQECLA